MAADADGSAFLVGEWLVEPELNRIVRNGEIVKIDPRNMRLLQLLASRPKQVVSQTEIERTVWSDVVVTPNSVYQSVAQLRRALGDEKANPRYIETIPRKGYRVVADISPAPKNELLAAAEIGDAPPSHSFTTRPRTTRRVKLLALGTVVLAVSVGAISGFPPEPFDLLRAERYEPGPVHRTHARPYDELLFEMSGTREAPHLRSHMLAEMATASLYSGRPNEARVYAQRAVEHERRIRSSTNPDTADRLTLLAYAYHWQAEYEAAEEAARAALRAFDSAPGIQPSKINTLRCLGLILADLGRFAPADTYLKQAIGLADRLYGESSVVAAETRGDLAMLRRMEGKLANAENILLPLIANRDMLSSYRVNEIMFRTQLADVLLAQQRYPEAKRQLETTMELIAANLRDDHPYAASAQELLGRSLSGLGEYEEAEVVLRRAMSIWREAGEWTWRIGRSASALGEAILAQGRVAEAEKYLNYASRALESAPNGQLEQLARRDHERRLQQVRVIAKEHQSSRVAQTADLGDL